jgi:predicted MFS family arabinose efflux permease
MTSDGRRILAAQALRAFGYGFTSVLLGVTLDARGWSTTRVGVLLSAVLLGTAMTSIVVALYGERLGRRRVYTALYLLLAVAGAVFSISSDFWVLTAVALTGALSTEVLESGPFTSLEQAMLPDTVAVDKRTRLFGVYNAVATIGGSAGALAAGGPALLRERGVGVGADHRFFALLIPAALIGAVVAGSLSSAVEAPAQPVESRRRPLRRSRPVVIRLAGLFAVDSFGGGFALQSFLVFFLSRKFGLDAVDIGFVFFLVGFLQAGSFMVATRLAERIGLLNTMVFTHLPSNLLLVGVALAPNAPTAIGLLLARFALSQMDVPTRQAYLVALVDTDERVAASAYTATAKYVVRPVAPVLAGIAQHAFLGLPLVLAAAIKSGYDVTLWSWLRHVPIATDIDAHSEKEVAGDHLLENRASAH